MWWGEILFESWRKDYEDIFEEEKDEFFYKLYFWDK